MWKAAYQSGCGVNFVIVLLQFCNVVVMSYAQFVMKRTPPSPSCPKVVVSLPRFPDPVAAGHWL